ncbi:[Fe-Fe] hydrogenase large subunit C-terminal domain-containing protein [Christensenella timonensis]|uniref:[Fe-Fe] hydrogenase large subunit C-terminal domain-containing protein n=1 Tax=Christensenella timonensis TaxID=1816678 RepID=UPI0008315983|nr:[Fe-Fe] hydrogenase large subunit C-terminal domain-containing protein [Christensenella timonensis]
MSIIQFKEANCKNCYKCIRSCQVKSIAFKNEQAEITERECILCGHCFLACPQNAKSINSSLETVKGYLKNGEKVYVSVAPSFASCYKDATFPKISAALKKLGFTGVEETSIGAAQVSRSFEGLMKEHKMGNIITTCCPTLVLLVEKYYPELVKYLAPVAAPMTAHGKMMKEVYGSRIKTVFIGPCISKIHEAQEEKGGGAIDAVLLFDEVMNWLKDEGVDLEQEDGDVREMKATVNRLYPIPGGIIQTIDKQARANYQCVAIDGIDRCVEILDSLKGGEITNYFLEMNACPGSCLGGPGLKECSPAYLLSKDNTLKYVKNRKAAQAPVSEDTRLDFSWQYESRVPKRHEPTEEEIQQVFLRMGKTSDDKILNCGGCGYSTCRDKAIAVLQGKADMRMCLPFMREKAESISNVVMDNTPNAIVILDGDFNLMEYNSAAAELFRLNEKNYVGRPISMIIDCDDIDEVRETGENIFDRKVYYKDLDITVEQSTIFIRENSIYLLLIKDITEDEHQQHKMNEMRAETVEVTQKVIDKQMRVAQEIASLLGETTAETKIALTNLKKYIQESEDERIY